jgi:hypothetical protein
MNLQYISDKNGVTTSVIIPIQDWEKLKRKYSELEKEESRMINMPDWHKGIIDQRLADRENSLDSSVDFGKAIDDIEKQL